MARLSWLVVLTAGCGPTFDEELTLLNDETQPEVATPDTYFPPVFARYALVKLEAPVTPYEVRSLTATLLDAPNSYQAQLCDTEAEVTLEFFVATGDDVARWEAEDGPTWTALASGVASGGPVGEFETSDAVFTLDKPVLVEEDGSLWVAYASENPDSGTIACLAGRQEPDLPVTSWQWVEDEAGFKEQQSRLWMSATVGIESE